MRCLFGLDSFYLAMKIITDHFPLPGGDDKNMEETFFLGCMSKNVYIQFFLTQKIIVL